MQQRRELDFYPTDSRLTTELLRFVDIKGFVFECCAGDGAIANVLYNQPDIDVCTNDINPLHNCIWNLDATLKLSWDSYWDADWVVTNPPFNCAHQIIPLAWERSKVGIAMLLRLTYLEPAKNRGEWLQKHSQYLTDLIIFGQPRPSFTGDGRNDSCTTAWFVWKKNPDTFNTRIHFVFDWKHYQGENHANNTN